MRNARLADLLVCLGVWTAPMSAVEDRKIGGLDSQTATISPLCIVVFIPTPRAEHVPEPLETDSLPPCLLLPLCCERAEQVAASESAI